MSHDVTYTCSTYRLGDIVDNGAGLGVAVIHGCQAVEALLSRRVPDLETDALPLGRRDMERHGARDKVGANSGTVVGGKGAGEKLVAQGRLARPSIANEDHLDGPSGMGRRVGTTHGDRNGG